MRAPRPRWATCVAGGERTRRVRPAQRRVSRAYYAAFHHARALLLVAGLEPKTHLGVVSLLLEHYEKPGRLEPGAVSILARLQTFRGLADYDASERLAKERAETEVAAARLFVEKARVLL